MLGRPVTAVVVQKGTMMDENQAREALASADAVASRMRTGRRPCTALILLLGMVMMLLTAVYGLLVQPKMPYTVPVLLLLPLLALGIYTATRPVLPRHYRALYTVSTVAGAGIYSLTVTLGSTCFSGSTPGGYQAPFSAGSRSL